MKLLVSMASYEVVEAYEDNALAFVDDVLNALYRFDSIQADTILLNYLWPWMITNSRAMIFSSAENKKRLFDLLRRIQKDIERILDNVQSEELASKDNEGEGSTALHQGDAEGLQKSSGDILHHWV